MAALSVTLAQPKFDWTLTVERTNWLETGRYSEALAFCEELGKLKNVRIVEIGKSPEGRRQIVVVISKDPDVLNPARRTKPLLYINNGIHSGEIEGKDATLILARRLLRPTGAPQEADWSGMLDKASLAFTPAFSVDAHERMSRYNRANQNGPVEMGWRVTGENLNLNRDWAKVDAVEMRNLLGYTNKIEPDFYIDNHTTDGGDWQYVVQYDVPRNPTMANSTVQVSQKFVDDVMPRCDGAGFLTAPYFGNFSERNPERGITVSSFGPRYSTGYWATRNRPSLLVETHVLKPYKQRLLGTLEINRLTLEWMGANASMLRTAGALADSDTRGMKEGDALVLSSRNSGKTRPFTFKGLKFDPYRSEISGGEIPRWSREKVEYETTIRDQFEPGVTVDAPAGWLVPGYLPAIIDRLVLHGIEVVKILPKTEGSKIKLSAQRFERVTFGTSPFEGRIMPRFQISMVDRLVDVPRGSVIVPVNQRLGRLAAQLLEPRADDSFAAWGFFNGFMEQKEYAEAYAMEPVAQKMLEDSAIKAAFEEALKDPAFAGNSGARLNWFFERSPFYDSRLMIHPVYRLTGEQLNTLTQ